MKNVEKVLSHIRVHPSFKKLGRTRCLNKLTHLLPPYIAKMVRFSYIKNDVLFFALAHPAAKYEFDNIINSIKTPLKKAILLCDDSLVLQDIKAFVSHKPLQKLPVFKPTIVQFHERSHAQFDNNFQNTKLHEIFEEIRTIIDAKYPQ